MRHFPHPLSFLLSALMSKLPDCQRGLLPPSLYAELPRILPSSFCASRCFHLACFLEKNESHVVAIRERMVPLNRKMAQVIERRETPPFARQRSWGVFGRCCSCPIICQLSMSVHACPCEMGKVLSETITFTSIL